MARDDRPSKVREKILKRRQMLKATGVGGAAMLAGCSGGGGDGGDGGGDGGGGDGGDGGGDGGGGDGGDGGDGGGDGGGGPDLMDTVIPIYAGANQVPTESFANEYSAESYNTRIGIYSYEVLGHFSTNREGGAGPVGVMAKDWGLVDSSTFEVTLYDNYQWTDGEPITTEDWKMKFAAEEMFELPLMTEVVESFEAVDDYTFRLNLQAENINPNVFTPQIFNFRFVMNTPAHTEYGEIIQKWIDGGGDEVVTELTNLEKTYMDQTLSGPFDIVDDASDRFVAEANTGHPAYSEGGHPRTGDRLNNARWHLMYISPDTTEGVPVKSGRTVNGGGPNNQGWYDNLSDQYKVLTAPGFKGHGLFLNIREDDFFAKKEVRQAIQYAINTQNLADNIGLKKFPVKLPHGLKTNVQGDATDFVSEDVVEGMNDYNWNENDLESAAEKLREAGASKQGDQWIRPNGEQISFEIEVPPWDGYAISHETVSQTLNDFGFDVSQLNIEAQVWFNKLGNYDFSAFNWFWGGEPYNSRTIQHLVEGTMPEGGTPQPITASIPWPPGQPDAEEQEIDAGELFTKYETSTGEEAQEAFDGLVWFVNQAMPMNPYTERIKKTVLDTQPVEWPPDGHVTYGHPRFNSLVYSLGWPQAKK
jgi:peptide/nickel transport system substrate-binding protein